MLASSPGQASLIFSTRTRKRSGSLGTILHVYVHSSSVVKLFLHVHVCIMLTCDYCRVFHNGIHNLSGTAGTTIFMHYLESPHTTVQCAITSFSAQIKFPLGFPQRGSEVIMTNCADLSTFWLPLSINIPYATQEATRSI